MIKTGIKFLDDEILDGGFPKGFLIMIAGEPGTGKTILTSQILYNGMEKYNEKAIFISFAETKDDFMGEMAALGMDFKKYEDAGIFKYIDLFTISPDAIEHEIELIMKEIIAFHPKRIAIDSITSLAQIIGTTKTRAFLHTTLGRFIKALGAVCFLITEKPIGKTLLGFGVEEFVADGVILLKHIKINEIFRRIFTIRKMRKKNIKRSQYEFVITEKGIVFLSLPELIRSPKESSLSRVTTGIENLDSYLSGGPFSNSITLIAGVPGSGKTTFCLHFALSNALNGKKTVYFSFDEQLGDLLRAARNYGFKIDKVLGNNLKIYCWLPEAFTPVHFFMKINNIIEEEKPEILILDSLTSAKRYMEPPELQKLIRYIQLAIKSNNIATYITLQVEKNHFSKVSQAAENTISDNVIFLFYDIKENRMKRKMMIVKTRASAHEKSIIDYDITSKGVVLYGPKNNLD